MTDSYKLCDRHQVLAYADGLFFTLVTLLTEIWMHQVSVSSAVSNWSDDMRCQDTVTHNSSAGQMLCIQIAYVQS